MKGACSRTCSVLKSRSSLPPTEAPSSTRLCCAVKSTRAPPAPILFCAKRDWLEKGLVDIHAIMETPKGDKHPHPFFAKLPEIESFAKSDRERKVVVLQRAFRVSGHALRSPSRDAQGSGRDSPRGFSQDL